MNIKTIAKINPGIAPAINSFVTDKPVKVPTITIGRLGGMIGPIVDEIEVTAEEKAGS